MFVVIGIPSFRRPEGLTTLLDSIRKIKFEGRFLVVVADNDNELRQGIKVVEDLNKSDLGFELESILVKERGISNVRNYLMDYAFIKLKSDYLVMIDDDEWVEQDWLSKLVATQLDTGAHIVGGKMIPIFNPEIPSWAVDLPIYYDKTNSTSGVVTLVHGTTNVLLSKNIISDFPNEKFDLSFSLIGGGDKEYFSRLKSRGAIFAYNSEAISYEEFSGKRITKEWAYERAFRIGSSEATIWRKLNKPFHFYLFEILKSLLALFSSLIFLPFCLSKIDRHVFYVMRINRQIGKYCGLLGYNKKVYKVVHGK